MIPKIVARKIFIAVNNPWMCSINEDPVDMSNQLGEAIGNPVLNKRLAIRSDFDAVPYGDNIFPMYRIRLHLEAIGTTVAIDLGEIIGAYVKDMVLVLKITNDNDNFTLRFDTDCEDLDDVRYRLKKNDFESRNRLT